MLVVIKTLDMNRFVCINTYLYILPEISGHQLMYGRPFFSCAIPTDTTILSDINFGGICYNYKVIDF